MEWFGRSVSNEPVADDQGDKVREEFAGGWRVARAELSLRLTIFYCRTGMGTVTVHNSKDVKVPSPPLNRSRGRPRRLVSWRWRSLAPLGHEELERDVLGG